MARRVLLWVAIVGGALALLCGIGLMGLVWLSRSFGADPQWTVVHKAPAQFHVKAGAVTDFHFRETGFQDPHYELLFAPADVEKFLEQNGLQRGAATTPAITAAPITATAATELEGFVDDQLFRSGQLWQAGGKTWVYLVAFGT